MNTITLTPAEAERFARITETSARHYREIWHSAFCIAASDCSCEELVREMMDSAQEMRQTLLLR